MFTLSDVDVDAVVVVRAHFAEQILQQLRRCLTRLNHEVEEIKSCEYAVAFGDMTAEAIAAAFLTANEGILLYHQRRYVFEAYRRLIHGNVEKLSQPVNHHGVAQGLDYGAALTADFQEVEDEQGEDLELVYEISFFIDDTDAVGVAVVGY